LQKARPLSDKEYADCFNVYKKISTEWETIQRWLADEFLCFMQGKESVDVLSVGSGTGDFDLMLMRLLKEKIPHINYRAIDPNQEHNLIFRQRYNCSNFAVDSFQIVPRAFDRKKMKGRYDIIHLTHCLYYFPDREAAVRQAWELLRPDGFLLIFHQTALGINELQRKFLARVKGETEEMFSAYDIRKLLGKMDIAYQHEILISDLDVTSCIEGSETGLQLLSFFMESHIEDAPGELKEEIIAFLKENCRIVDGRYFLFHPGGIFWMRKMP